MRKVEKGGQRGAMEPGLSSQGKGKIGQWWGYMELGPVRSRAGSISGLGEDLEG